MAKIQFLDTSAAFALRVKQLQDRLAEQMEDAMAQFGLGIAGKTTGIVQLLYSEGPASTAQIAQRLRYSHQLAAQRLSWLLEHGMAIADADKNDRRRQIIKLTKRGLAQAEKLQRFLPQLRDAYADLFEELGFDLDAAIVQANSALDATPLTVRFSKRASGSKGV